MDDKISGLPDDLLEKILSFVPTKVAVSTSILSKRWEFLSMWLPKLDYTCSSSEHGLGDFINKNLTLHRAPVIESLCLNLVMFPDIIPKDIRLWVEIAVSRHVREIEISYYRENENIFPISLFTCDSLITLKLSGVILTDVPSVGCFMKTLQLTQVTLIGENFLQEFLSVFPVLEDLSVDCYNDANMKEFTIVVLSLQSLSLFIPDDWVLDVYEIDTTSLKYFKLEDWNCLDHYTLINNMPKLKEAYIEVEFPLPKSVISSIISVKRLTICSEGVYGDGFVFNQLEHLKLCVSKKYSSNLLG